MNVLELVFGILRGGGLVAEFDREGFDPRRPVVAGFGLLLLGAGVFGFAVGIAHGVIAAWQVAVKVPSALLAVFLVALPAFVVTFRALGGSASGDRFAMLVFSGPLAAALVLTVCTPIVFLESLVGGGHVIAVASVVAAGAAGVAVMSFALWRGVPAERSHAVVSLAVGLLFVAGASVFAAKFFAPYDAASPVFSDGLGRLLALISSDGP